MTTLREAAQQALEALEAMNPYPASKEDQRAYAITALRAALAENDKRMEWYQERKANWDLQRKLASETEERDRQRREYDEERLEPTVPSDCAADSHQQAAELRRLHAELERCKQVCAATAEGWRVDAALAEPEGGGNLPPPLPAEHYCDTHCTWADHAAGCVRAHGIGGNDD